MPNDYISNTRGEKKSKDRVCQIVWANASEKHKISWKWLKSQKILYVLKTDSDKLFETSEVMIECENVLEMVQQSPKSKAAIECCKLCKRSMGFCYVTFYKECIMWIVGFDED